mgnify:CR=1 FL=1
MINYCYKNAEFCPEIFNYIKNNLNKENLLLDIKYGRTEGVNFKIGCYLNIGIDHISAVEHPDFEEHAAYVKEHSPRFYAEVTNGFNS